MKRAVLFDLYGTLVDIKTDEKSDTVWAQVSTHLADHGARIRAKDLRQRYEDICTEEAVRLGEGFLLEAALHRLWQDTVGRPCSRQELNDLAASIRHASVTLLSLRDYALPLLERLRASDLMLVLVSNTESLFTTHDLERVDLTARFDKIVMSSDEGVAKPDPELLRIALQRVDLPPEDVVLLGDSVSADIGAARAAGIDAILISPEPAEDSALDYVVAPPKLLPLLAALRSLGCVIE